MILNLFESSDFWVVLSTILFFYIIWRYARLPLLRALDSRSDRIRGELEEAERLHIEAKQLLSRYRRRHEEALKEAEQIIADAHKQALDMKTAAEEALKADIERKEKQFEERLIRMEKAAVENVRDKIVELSMRATEDLLKKNLAGKKSATTALNDDTIATLDKNLTKSA